MRSACETVRPDPRSRARVCVTAPRRRANAPPRPARSHRSAHAACRNKAPRRRAPHRRRQRAGAIDQRVAALDHDIGIGADHEQRTRRIAATISRYRPAFPSCRRRDPSTPHNRRVRAARSYIEARENRMVALRTEMETLSRRAYFDNATGDVARTRDCVIGRRAAHRAVEDTHDRMRRSAAHW